jgi:alkylation response protein AidB-like acyl-CoA dehydrogenase
MPTADVTILDTWYTTGLRGSGSNDYTVTDYFVPAERTFSYQQLEFRREGPLYQFALNILYKGAAPALGAARGAIDALVADGTRPSRRMTVAGAATPQRALRDEAFVQDAIGRAEARLGAARAYAYGVIGELYDTIAAGKPPGPQLMTHVLLMYPQIHAMCLEAAELVFKARGGSAVYAHGPLDRYLRDLVTMNQHVVNSERMYATIGRGMLGFPPEGLLL